MKELNNTTVQNEVTKSWVALNALAEHVEYTGFQIDWSSNRVLVEENKLASCQHLESLHIHTAAHILNKIYGTLTIYFWCLHHAPSHT